MGVSDERRYSRMVDGRPRLVLPNYTSLNYIAQNGPVAAKEMNKTFNMGIGMALIVNDQDIISDLKKRLQKKHNLNSYQIGKIK